ncbi:MAG: transcription-repair coupling factor [Anaerolineales bacterium]|nr:transcription-repair coupling factor [Anaerolineales bacterium]
MNTMETVKTSLNPLLQVLDKACQPLIEALKTNRGVQPSLGLRRSARLPILAALYRQLSWPLVLLTDRADHALTVLDELALWLPDALRLYFPEPTPLFYENAAWGESTRRDRLMALTTLATYHIPGAPAPQVPPILVAPARALMTRTLPRREFLKASRILRLGQTIQPDELIRLCLSLGYESVNTVIAFGQYARRGGILDLWPPAEPQPVRLDFFGDEIDTLRRFDPATQRTLKKTDDDQTGRVLITPAREFLIGPDTPALNESEAYSEFMLPRLHPAPASLLDYLPRQALVLIEDQQMLEETINEVEEQALAMRQDFIQEGTLEADFPIPYLTWSEILDSLGGHLSMELGSLSNQPASEPLSPPGPDQGHLSLADRFTPGTRFGGRLKPVLEHMTEHHQAGEQIVIVSRQCGRLREFWTEQSPANDGLKPPLFIDGSLSEGWSFLASDDQLLHLLTDGEIFGWRRPEPRRRAQRAAEAPEAGYVDLQIDDWVVHVDHGIGRYKGLVRRTVDGIEHEYLCIEYADEAQLFVPVHQADRLTRYVGADNRPPTPSRLGSSEWRSVKSHVKEAVREVAEDLLELYARRSVVEGYSFQDDTPWQQELEASFPYIETDDQMRVLAEVKRDMQSWRPMDRLICGDVGYGKTEVALRAAFKAVMDGKQVAILVPTTVLAQQHYHTFGQRLAAFPMVVEMLSRFRTPHQQRDIIERLAQGQVDIVIGTHRLLSGDVSFKDLGLLIIDEEQRFGVTHKETLKKMRTEVDVLTLTATPIPRTLYMALSGVRDISTINTPPEERLPIVTHVGPYSPRLVRQAILRELERGGQVFFVHNRVQTIGAIHLHLKQLLPEARITVAHGQMAETELAQRMDQFSNGEVDILLSTSIIESGLDIPNANTLIVDRADTFGLAQLYQLRGRVGRGAQRAYAYFFRHNRKLPSLEGRQRLETIAENTQLGAGFSIAMRDLEIRGTGDILGTRQHGYIATVGFHLYTSLLAEAVKNLRSEQGLPATALRPLPGAQFMNTNVELPIPVSIPADYVPDKTVRLGLYRRLADTRSLAELDALHEEFQDRFGLPPEPVLNLFYQLRVRMLADRAGLASITVESGQFVMRFPEGNLPDDLPDLGPQVRVGKVTLWMPHTALIEWKERLVEVLEKLLESRTKSE